MRSPSLEYFYAKIEKLIHLVRGYTEIGTMEFIIKACRLKPYKYVFEERKDNIILYEWWFDEFGNSLVIDKKRINIIHNDLRLNTDKIVCTDLYYGLSLERMVKMSKAVYLCAGKDEDLYQDCYLLTLLGMDEYLRSYLYWFGEWKPVSPLLMGMKHLQWLASHAHTKKVIKLSNSINAPIPCVSGNTYLSCLPIQQDFAEMIKQHHEILRPILT